MSGARTRHYSPVMIKVNTLLCYCVYAVKQIHFEIDEPRKQKLQRQLFQSKSSIMHAEQCTTWNRNELEQLYTLHRFRFNDYLCIYIY